MFSFISKLLDYKLRSSQVVGENKLSLFMNLSVLHKFKFDIWDTGFVLILELVFDKRFVLVHVHCSCEC